MSETKFTPGPWVLIDGDNFEKEKVITTQDRDENSMGRICELDVEFIGHHGIEQDANAKLISAATDLYEAAIKSMKLLESLGLEPSDEYQELLFATRKARGEFSE